MKLKLRKFFNAIRKHKIMTFFVVMVIIVFGYFGYGKNQKEETVGQIQTAKVEKGDIAVTVTGSGQIYAKSQVDLQGVAAGDGIEIKSINVKNDQEVKEGDLIAVLDTAEALKKVRDAELALQAALISQKQTNELYNNETREDKWQRQSQEIIVQQKRNALSDAKDDLEDYYIRAPFDGIITGLSVNAGDSVSRDDVIASIITKEMYGKISLNEVDAAKVKKGNRVTLSFDAFSGEKIQGEISKIDTIGMISQNVVIYNAEISFQASNKLLKPGMSVNAEIAVESKEDVLLVPNSMIEVDEKGTYVRIFNSRQRPDENSAGNQPAITKKYIETGITDEIKTEVVKGLSEGESVVTKISSSSSEGNDSGRGALGVFGGMPGGGMRR